jgi:hypothetical protein
MPYCCVPGCGNKSSDPRCSQLTFHRLPITNKQVLEQWIEKLNLNEQYIPDHYRVCSAHFDLTCFRQSAWTSKRCVVPGSIPNKFLVDKTNHKANSETSDSNRHESVEPAKEYNENYLKSNYFKHQMHFKSNEFSFMKSHQSSSALNLNLASSSSLGTHSHLHHNQLADTTNKLTTMQQTTTSLNENTSNEPGNLNLSVSTTASTPLSSSHFPYATPSQQAALMAALAAAASMPHYNLLNHLTITNSNNSTSASDLNSSSYLNNPTFKFLQYSSSVQDSKESESLGHSRLVDEENKLSGEQTPPASNSSSQTSTPLSSSSSTSSSSSASPSPRKKGLSDVITKLHKQNHSVDERTPVKTSSGHFARGEEELADEEQDDEHKKEQEHRSEDDPSNTAQTIDSMSHSTSSSANSHSTLPNEYQMSAAEHISAIINVVAAQNLSSPPLSHPQSVISAIDVKPTLMSDIKVHSKSIVNKACTNNQMDLYKLLEKANLVQYYTAFTEQGGDDLNQLCEADDDEFKEIVELVGMASKPLHVKRLRKALDEHKSGKSTKSDGKNNFHSFFSLTNTDNKIRNERRSN